MGRRLSEEENERRQRVAEKGLTDRESAEILGISRKAYSSWSSRSGYNKINFYKYQNSGRKVPGHLQESFYRFFKELEKRMEEK